MTIIVNEFMELIGLLEKIGLSEKQAKIYLACLELGGAKISDIARKSKIKRTSCYHLIGELLTAGLISKTKQKGSNFLWAEDPKDLIQSTQTKMQTIEEIIPQLNAIYNVLPQKPKISLYEGIEGVKIVWEQILKTSQAGDIILAYTGLNPTIQHLPKKWRQDYIKRRVAKKVRIRFITPSVVFMQEYKENPIKNLREVMLVNVKNQEFTADMQICGNKVSIVSPKENFISIIIDSKEISQMMKMAFELMWRGAN